MTPITLHGTTKTIQKTDPSAVIPPIIEKKVSKMSPWNLAIGAGIQIFEVSTLGQPFEVLKTQMAANRSDSLALSIKKTYKRGGLRGFYQGLIPWAWIEASTKGGVLLFSSSILTTLLPESFSPSSKAVLSGMGGGLAQAYTTMGFCTLMKTVEITRSKTVSTTSGTTDNVSTLEIAKRIIQKDGILAMNRGVSAVALRQMTNWGSRFGFSKLTEEILKSFDNSAAEDLSTVKKLSSSIIGGTLGCWNQPIEVIRVEMQRSSSNAESTMKMAKSPSIFGTAKTIYTNNGIRGFYRGITPRIGLSIYLTVCMVFGGDRIKEHFGIK